MLATISPHRTGVADARATAATMGIVAWPPQVTMFTTLACRCSSRFTAETTKGPRAAGVRSTSFARWPARRSAWTTWAFALVASKITSRSAQTAWASRPSMPSDVVATPRRAARARPSLCGSMPTMSAGSSVVGMNRHLAPRGASPEAAARVDGAGRSGTSTPGGG